MASLVCHISCFPQPKHYTEKEYAKRLIGNAFSIPTMEFLLQPLTPFFGKRRYSTVDYVFAWAGWNPADDESPKRSERVKRLMHEVADDQDEENEEGSTCEPTVTSSGYNSSATLIVTTLAHARESLGKLSLPPASAMEEVDRRLMSGANDVEDDENDEEDFDV